MKTLKMVVIGFVVLAFITGCAPFKGKDGSNGKDGVNGQAGTQGDTGIQGPQGSQGVEGPQGSQGPKGDAGDSGSPGLNATSVTVVQLCPGTTTYPSTFVEIAFCVAGNLYGTYSANGGFSTLLPPGAYSSNAINSTCNFVVGPNCQITN